MKYKYGMILSMCFLLSGCSVVNNTYESSNDGEYQFAVLSDTHVQDVNGEFNSDEFTGANLEGKNYTIRPMYEQMTSTRLFNENYYAFIQALDNIAADGIKDVVITGDISDDGQAMNIKEVNDILKDYQKKYDMRFYIVPGNHEPPSPNAVDQGDDFLKADGTSVLVKSTQSEECQNQAENVVCDDQMLSMSQEEMADVLSDYGYMAKEDDILWATPFSSYDLEDYDYNTAKEEMELTNRSYQTCNDSGECKDAYDMTYVVEPIDGYLFLCVDGDVYVPNEEGDFDSMSDNGLNSFNEYKSQTMDFIKEVYTYASDNDLEVVFFDHYPLADFYGGTSEELKSVFGEDGLEFARLASDEVTQEFADLGVGLMFSGHMHYNGTGVYQNNGDFLVDVMTASTAAYVPSYKEVTASGDQVYEIETKVLDEVKNFDTLFPLYEKEYEYESSLSDAELEELGITPWDESILEAENYGEFNQKFLEQLVKNRHYPEWSEELHAVFDNLSLYDLVIYSQINAELSPSEFKTKLTDGQYAEIQADFDQQIEKYNVDKKQIQAVSGLDIVTTFYKFLSARELAYADYTDEQINAYSAAITYLNDNPASKTNENYTKNALIILDAIDKLANDIPSDHFKVDLKNKEITDLSDEHLKINHDL